METTSFFVEGQTPGTAITTTKARVVVEAPQVNRVAQQQQQQQQQQQLNRRSRMETYCDILKVVGAGAEKPTHIMYKANLSWTVMQSYIRDLENQSLISSRDAEGKRLYSLTEKGFSLLKQYEAIKDDLHLSSEE